jgi:CheY-like chemotaxis protein
MFQANPNNRLSVLLAHDSDGWQETVRRLLEPQGVHTVAVRSGRDALDVIQNTQIHVAVLDQQMPHLGGLQVIKLMRDIKSAPPSILLTAHLTDHLLHEALGMHVFSVLSKPVDLNLLLDALARVLKKRYASRWPAEGDPH